MVMEMIDFTDCPRVPERACNGANGKKIAVSYQGGDVDLKFPPNNQSYSNSCISEHLGSTIFYMVGIPAQETLFGIHVNGSIMIIGTYQDQIRVEHQLYRIEYMS